LRFSSFMSDMQNMLMPYRASLDPTFAHDARVPGRRPRDVSERIRLYADTGATA
jgi:hypothetical protein